MGEPFPRHTLCCPNSPNDSHYSQLMIEIKRLSARLSRFRLAWVVRDFALVRVDLSSFRGNRSNALRVCLLIDLRVFYMFVLMVFRRAMILISRRSSLYAGEGGAVILPQSE